MDVFVTRANQRFVWDSDKASINLNKHGISFDKALEVFFDPLHELIDAGGNGEERLAAIGLDLERRILFVVHVEAERNAIRIISARQATGAERRIYADAE